MSNRVLWLVSDEPCEGIPIAVIGPNTNPISGQYVLNGANSSPNGCVSGITTYTWGVFSADGVTPLAQGLDYILNSPDLNQTTLDITFPASENAIIKLTVDSACGNHTTEIPLVYVSNPVRGNTGSDLNGSATDPTAMILSTGGSDDGSGGDISDSPLAAFEDNVYWGNTIGVNQLFRIFGSGGSTPTFSNWHASLNAADQSAIVAAITGTIGSTGLSINKTTIRDILFARDPITFPDGSEWVIEQKVTYQGVESGTISISVKRFTTVTDYAISGFGFNGSPSTALNPAVHYGDVNGIKSQANAGGYFTYTRLKGQYTTGPLTVDPAIQVLEVDTVNLSHTGVNVAALPGNYVNYIGEFENPNITNFRTYFIAFIGVQTGDTVFDYGRLNKAGGAAPYFSVVGSNGNARINLRMDFATGTLLGDDSIASQEFECQFYPEGTSSYVVTGNEAPLNNSGNPETLTFGPGGTPVTVTDLNAQTIGEFTPIASGDYLHRVRSIGVSGRYSEMWAPERIKLV